MSVRSGALALTPLLLFLALFFGAGLYYTAQGEPMGFYQLRAPVAIETHGGTLTIDWDGANGSVIMTGPAATVFEGTIEI